MSNFRLIFKHCACCSLKLHLRLIDEYAVPIWLKTFQTFPAMKKHTLYFDQIPWQLCGIPICLTSAFPLKATFLHTANHSSALRKKRTYQISPPPQFLHTGWNPVLKRQVNKKGSNGSSRRDNVKWFLFDKNRFKKGN